MPTRRVLLVVSDGEHTVNTDRQAIIDAASAFKAAGGIVLAVGARAAGNGFDLLERISSPGFFINADTAVDNRGGQHPALNQLSYLKSILCVGRCVPPGDVYVNQPMLSYPFPSTSLWEVPQGLVNLLGPGLLDLLPGHGLFLEMAGKDGTTGAPALLRTIDSYELKAGRDYEVTVFAAGNQRSDIAGQQLKVYLRAIDAADTDPNLFERTLAPAWNAEFSEFSYAFNAIADQPVKLYVEQLYSGTAPTMGNLVDRITLTDVTTNTVLLDDNFDNENLTYIPPRCGPSAALAEIDNPDPPTAEVYFESGLALPQGTVPPDTISSTEAYQYAVSYVTQEGETAATTLLISGDNTSVSKLDSVILVQMPVPDDPRVLSKRLWRTLGVEGGSYPDGSDLYLLADVDPRQVNYLDAERSDDFAARYDNSITAPEENTTTVPAGELGLGAADCCYQMYAAEELPPSSQPLVPTMVGTDLPEGYRATMGATSPTLEEAWWFPFDDTDFTTRVYLANSGGGVIDPATEYIQMQFLLGPKRAFSYSIRTEQSPDQLGPSAWKLYGSNNGIGPAPGPNWTELDDRSGITPWTDHETKTFTVASPGSYSYYRLAFSATTGSLEATVAAVQFYGDAVEVGTVTSYVDNCPDCTAVAPGAQVPARQPLPNIESTDQPPVINSTKEACVFCGPDQQQAVNQVPVMTSNTAPSGTASANSETDATHAAWHAFDGNNGTFWQPTRADAPWTLAYAFAAATTVNYYRIYPGGACPLSWTFEGSDDGSTWTVLDTQTNVQSWAGFAQDFFPATEASFKRYRLNITNSIGGATAAIVQIQSFDLMFVTGVAQSCATAVGTGATSAEADADAYAKALIEANRLSNCVPKWTSTVSYTARCPDIGQLGNPVTKIVTKTSLVSFNDAHTQAYDEAKAAAEAELVCTLSNNEQQINIVDNGVASPYPSVLRVTSGPASIANVVVNIFGLSHGSIADVHVALRSPAGTVVELFRNRGGNVPVTNVDLVFEDGQPDLPDPIVSGTWKPTVTAPFAPYPAPLRTYVDGVPDSTPYGIVLNAATPAGFAGEDANGSWSLWCWDDLSLFSGKISKWTLTIT